MFLSSKTLRSLILNGSEVILKDGSKVSKTLIDPVSEERFSFIEGSKYDLTLGSVERMSYDSIACIGEQRMVPSAITEFPVEGWWMLRPRIIYLLQTLETLNLPINLLGIVRPRTTLFRCGIAIQCSDIDPNYQGRITVMAEVRNVAPVKIQVGSRFLHVKFAEFDTFETDFYRGIWGLSGYNNTTNGEVVRGY